jgi:hypothetical protein
VGVGSILAILWFLIVAAGGAIAYAYLCNLDCFRPRRLSLSLTVTCMWFVLISSVALLSALLAPGGWDQGIFVVMEWFALGMALLFGAIALVGAYVRDGPRW